MKQRHDDTHHYQQIMSALPRALASEQQTSKLKALKTKLHEIASNSNDAIITFELSYSDFSAKSNPKTFASLEKSANDLVDCANNLHRTVIETINQIDSCTSVIAETRAEWRESQLGITLSREREWYSF
ncbi:hypothetical protein PENTCL1PPCAC_26098 [Pristionchus entomophagus]|uniref:Uncharacterized protein n=1 Tax=Pristionchus entomophagus TaxID=358040 RepID=A0AAV5UC48_9BILA|nr:hypothetical protein PENTCL1PPCAC_26098 [Pristionchus entomophagus]